MGLVCRVLEERGIATVCVATGRDLAAQVKPPRTLFVNHPMGNNFGGPADREMQLDILRTALDMIHTAMAGELVDYPTSWDESYEFKIGR